MNAKHFGLVIGSLFTILSVLAVQAADPAVPAAKLAVSDFGLAVGKKMPFHVADFFTGRAVVGCPSVMISNGQTRGVIVWTRSADDAALRLAQALDGKAVNGTRLHGYLIAFDQSADGLKEKTKEFKHVVAGKSRDKGKEQFDGRGIAKTVEVLVFFLDRKDIKAMWSFAADELTEAKVAEITAQAERFESEAKVVPAAGK